MSTHLYFRDTQTEPGTGIEVPWNGEVIPEVYDLSPDQGSPESLVELRTNEEFFVPRVAFVMQVGDAVNSVDFPTSVNMPLFDGTIELRWRIERVASDGESILGASDWSPLVTSSSTSTHTFTGFAPSWQTGDLLRVLFQIRRAGGHGNVTADVSTQHADSFVEAELAAAAPVETGTFTGSASGSGQVSGEVETSGAFIGAGAGSGTVNGLEVVEVTTSAFVGVGAGAGSVAGIEVAIVLGAFDGSGIGAGSVAGTEIDTAEYWVFRRSPPTGESFDPEVDTPVATIEHPTTVYDDTGLSEGEHEWQVFAYDGSGFSDGSALVTAEVTDTTITVDLEDLAPSASDGASVDVVVSLEIGDVAPFPQDAISAERGATAGQASDEAGLPLDAVAIEARAQLSVGDTAPLAIDAASISVAVSASASDQAPIAADSIEVDSEVSAAVSDQAPVPGDSADVSVVAQVAVNDAVPQPTDSISVDRGPTLAEISDVLRVPQDSIDVHADSLGFNINDVGLSAIESGHASVEIQVQASDGVPAALDSVDAASEITASVEDAGPLANDAADVSVVARATVSDVASLPIEGVAVDRGPTTVEASDALRVPQDSIGIHADSPGFNVNDIGPAVTEDAAASVEVRAEAHDAPPAPLDSVGASCEVASSVEDSGPLASDAVGLIAIVQPTINDLAPLPAESVSVDRGPTTADAADVLRVPQDSIDAHADSLGFNINDVGPSVVESASASTEVQAQASDGVPVALDSAEISCEVAGSSLDTSPAPSDGLDLDVGVDAQLADLGPQPTDAAESAVAVTAQAGDELPSPTDEADAGVRLDSEIADKAPLPQDSISTDVQTAGFVVNDLAAMPVDATALNVDTSIQLEDFAPLPDDNADARLGVTATALDAPSIPIDSVSAGVDVTATAADFALGPNDSASASIEAIGDFADLAPTASDSIDAQVDTDVEAYFSDVVPLPHDEISATSLALIRTFGLFDEFDRPARFDDLEGRFSGYLNEERVGRFDDAQRMRWFAQDERSRLFSQSVHHRIFPTTTRVARFQRTDQARRFVFTTVAREEEPMELEIVEFGPYTVNEVPEPLYVRVHETLRDGSTKPMELHGQQPEWTARVSIQPPSGTVETRGAEIVDPQTLTTAEPDNFQEAEEGWVRVDWDDGDFTESGVYEVQLTLDNGDLRLKSTAVYKPNVVTGPAADVVGVV